MLAHLCLVVLLLAQQPSDADVYAHFRAWVSSAARTEANKQGDVLDDYRKLLVGEGVPPAEADRRVRVVRDNARRLEIDTWNRILTSPTPAFNVQPNAFLVRMIKGVRPGTALDVGMGQGRNAIYLAQQGWAVTGFDPAEKALAAGGRVVVEAFHRDSLKNGPIGAGVVYDTNELLKLFDRFRVIHYEDVEDASDFGKGVNRVVRLVAQKP